MMWPLAVKLTQRLPAEMAHDVAIKALSWGLGPKQKVPALPVSLAGMTLPNPLGLAAGFDKNAAAFDGAHHLGFGFVEVGTITPEPQPGNPRPRVFRLASDEAVINRYGFNGKGMKSAAHRLRRRDRQNGPIIGINIGANKVTEDKTHDYYKTASYLGGLADYITVNISSPNTPGLRDLQDADALRRTLEATFDGLKEADVTPPVFVKLAPDLTQSALWQSLEAVGHYPVKGVILTNTTITRPETLRHHHKTQTGGLSGRPVAALSEASLVQAMAFASAHQSDLAFISVGGIFDARDVYLRLRLGASATQLYSALSLQGPYLPAKILHELDAMLAIHADGPWTDNVHQLAAPTMSYEAAREEAHKLYVAMSYKASKARR